MPRPGRALTLLLALAACGPVPPERQPVTLPETARQDPVTDPARSAILSSAYVFGRPQVVAGDPAAVTEALGRLEFLAVELATGPRWIGLDPVVPVMMRAGRDEARAAFGFDPRVPPQQAMDALFGASAALRQGDRARAAAALAPLTGPQGAEPALARLAELPYLPRAAAATAQAQQGMNRLDRGGGRLWRF